MKYLVVFLFLGFSARLFAQISIIGPASPSGNWATDHNLTETPAGSGVWTGAFTLSVGELKFRLDGEWTFNWGGTAWPSGAAIQGGANINVASAGVYNIEFNLTAETYSFTPPPPANVGIGTTSPTEKLDVAGNIKTTGEIKPNGTAGQANQVLTSNGDGTMQWAAMSNGGESNGYGTWGDCSLNNITAYNPVANQDGSWPERFGESVSITGQYAIIGAYQDDEGGFTDNGSATIYKRNSSGEWMQDGPKLTNPDPEDGDQFGISVAISGDYAIVGAANDDEAGQVNCGSATIFKRNAITGNWIQDGPKLTNISIESNDNFGTSVSISGEYVIIGAPNDDDDGYGTPDIGSATIFKRNANTGAWVQQGAKLIDSDPYDYDNFGNSVSISGDYAVVGAVNDNMNNQTNTGSATVFKRNSSEVWVQDGPKLGHFPQAYQGIGYSVSISGDFVLVGIPNISNAHIFKRNAITESWQVVEFLYNQTTPSPTRFGHSVSLCGDYAIVGATRDDIGTGRTDNGSTSIFRRCGIFWLLVQKFTHPNSQNEDFFGSSTAIDSIGRFLVGASGVEGNAGMAFFGKVK